MYNFTLSLIYQTSRKAIKNQKPNKMNQEFFNTLSGAKKVIYKSTYQFHLQHSQNATHESAHQVAYNKIKNVEKLANKFHVDQPFRKTN